MKIKTASTQDLIRSLAQHGAALDRATDAGSINRVYRLLDDIEGIECELATRADYDSEADAWFSRHLADNAIEVR